jgi:hypothetical protein
MDNGHEPATKADLKQFGSDLRSELKESYEQLRSEFHRDCHDLKKCIRDGQTELLKAFYNYAQSNDAKLKDSEQSDAVIRERLTAVEMRVKELEKRLNLPPAA